MANETSKPTPDFPLSARRNGQWAKKMKGKFFYFGPLDDPQGALKRYNEWLSGIKRQKAIVPSNGKPRKPHPDFPLYAHRRGQWAKKVLGKVHYFGPWGDPQAALEKWNAEKDDLLAGREPAPPTEGLTIEDLVDAFLTSKKRKVESGDIQQRTWDDYKVVCDKVVAVFGLRRAVADLRPADFEKLRSSFAKTHGPVALFDDIARTRAVFNYGAKNLDQPVRYGDQFNRPSQAVLRRERQKNGTSMFQADQLRAMLAGTEGQLHAMILLGINCGFHNRDCAMLPMRALDLDNGWMDFGRLKTGIDRRCPLWQETIDALRNVLAARPKPKEPEAMEHVFVTRCGQRWQRKDKLTSKGKANIDDPISKETTKLLKELSIHRRGLGFKALRHTFETIGLKSRDKPAVSAIMGHAAGASDMSAVYNEEPVDDDRLLAVVTFVHNWLFPGKSA